MYDLDIYPAGYVKDGSIRGKVTIFHTGKLISVGANNILLSFHNLDHAKELLVSAEMVGDIRLKPQVRNIVATADVGHEVDLPKLARRVPNTMYEPDQFQPQSGLISNPSRSSGELGSIRHKLRCGDESFHVTHSGTD